MTEPVGGIRPQAPVPSILTSATDRSGDDFGAHVPAGPPGPPGATPASRASWRSGIGWPSASCQQSFAWPWCAEATTEEPDGHGKVESHPFLVYTPLTCTWSRNESEVGDAALALNEAHKAWSMSRAVWLGEGLDDADDGQPTLRRAAVDMTPSPGTAVTIDEAFEQLLVAYELGTFGNGNALFHMPGVLSVQALGGGNGGAVNMRPEGNVYRGPLGSTVSPGPGYPMGPSTEGPDGFGPEVSTGVYAGNDDDEVWLYVSGPLEYAFGPLEDPVFPDPSSHVRRNTTEVWARRLAIYRFDPCSVWAVLVQSPVSIAGGS